jgi:hypothetical protein
MSILRVLSARFLTSHMVAGLWKYLVPFAILQVLAVEFMLT